MERPFIARHFQTWFRFPLVALIFLVYYPTPSPGVNPPVPRVYIPCAPGEIPDYEVNWRALMADPFGGPPTWEPVTPPVSVPRGTIITATVDFIDGDYTPGHWSDDPNMTGNPPTYPKSPWPWIWPNQIKPYSVFAQRITRDNTKIDVIIRGSHLAHICNPASNVTIDRGTYVTGTFNVNGGNIPNDPGDGGPQPPAVQPWDPGYGEPPVSTPPFLPWPPTVVYPIDNVDNDGEIHGEVTLDAPPEKYKFLAYTNHPQRGLFPTLCQAPVIIKPYPPGGGPAEEQVVDLSLSIISVNTTETPIDAYLIIQPGNAAIANADYEIRSEHNGQTSAIITAWPHTTSPPDRWNNYNPGNLVYQCSPAKGTRLKIRPKISNPRPLSFYARYQPIKPANSLVAYKDTRATQLDLIPIDIEEVISDQIAGNEANKLPSPYFGGNPAKPENGYPNNPMLMATRTGSDARLMIKMNVPAAQAASIRVGVRETGQTTILNSVASVAPPGKTPLSFTALAGTKLYEVVTGYDANGNSVLENSEAAVVFEKTPRKDKEGNTATANLHLIDKFRVVTQADFNAARTTTDNHADGDLIDLYDSAEGLLKAFARGSAYVPEVPEATTTWGHLLLGSPSPSPQGLSHPVGGSWTAPANNTTTLRFEWPTGSDLSEDVVASDGLEAMIKRLLVKHKATLAAAATTTESAIQLNALTDDGINFRETDKNYQVHVALGACRYEGGMQVKVKKGAGTALEVSEVNCWGALFDLYDWGYDAPQLKAPNGTVIGEPREAAKVQAGFATLASSTSWPSAGRVFFTKVNFGTGWIDLDVTIP